MCSSSLNLSQLAEQIKTWGRELGFQQIAITDTNLSHAGRQLNDWIERGFQGGMRWLSEHGDKRWQPEILVPGTRRIIIGRMDYLPPSTNAVAVLRDDRKAYISRYALGRDYHKLIRKRLATLGKRIEEATGEEVIQRPFVDSAPVLEKPLAEKAGLGWQGKNTLILNDSAGSWFFLGELYTSLELPVDVPSQSDRCGSCRACLTICPTNAFPEPYVLDARRCISYLTIEHKGAIDEALRPLMGNRVFGCDDCQLICPWNRFAKPTAEGDFHPRHNLSDTDLADLFQWSEAEFEEKTAGSPIRRIGYQRWQRNLAVGLGNSNQPGRVINTLIRGKSRADSLVREHIEWALNRLSRKPAGDRPKPFPIIASEKET